MSKSKKSGFFSNHSYEAVVKSKNMFEGEFYPDEGCSYYSIMCSGRLFEYKECYFIASVDKIEVLMLKMDDCPIHFFIQFVQAYCNLIPDIGLNDNEQFYVHTFREDSSQTYRSMHNIDL